MNANLMTKVIEMTKAESKAAGRVGTDAFADLAKLREAYPDFRIEIRTTKSKDGMKGLTVSYMEKYILDHDDEDGTIMAEFRVLRGQEENGKKDDFRKPVSYGELKLWFLAHYPQLETMAKVDEIMARAKDARNKHKLAHKAA